MRVLVTGSFDPLHSGHVKFFREAAKFGDLYIGIGSDESITKYKHPVYMPQEERLYMVRAIQYVKDAWINSGEGSLDFIEEMSGLDILVVNEDQDIKEKRIYCKNMGIEYIVLPRLPEKGLPVRTSSNLRK